MWNSHFTENGNWDEVSQSAFATRVKIINNSVCQYCEGTNVDYVE